MDCAHVISLKGAEGWRRVAVLPAGVPRRELAALLRQMREQHAGRRIRLQNTTWTHLASKGTG
jgi:hypothetical protein